jgi:hypothetical protein
MTGPEMNAATLNLLRQVVALMVEVDKQTAELCALREQQATPRQKPTLRTGNIVYLSALRQAA